MAHELNDLQLRILGLHDMIKREDRRKMTTTSLIKYFSGRKLGLDPHETYDNWCRFNEYEKFDAYVWYLKMLKEIQ